MGRTPTLPGYTLRRNILPRIELCRIFQRFGLPLLDLWQYFLGKQVETLKKYVKKGKEIVVKGKLVQGRWETPEGEKRSKLEIRLDTFEGFSFTSGGKRTDENGEPAPATAGEKKKLF